MKKNVLIKNVIFLLMVVLLLNVSSCSSSDDITIIEETEDPADEDPVDEDPISGDPILIIKNVQEDFLKFYEELNMGLMQINRQTYMFGSYAGNQGNSSDATNSWRAAYRVLENSFLLQNLNELETYNVPAYVGVAEVLQAFTFLVSVDIWGNIPYSEAVNPEQFPNPNPDTGASVYNAQLELLDKAILHLNETTSDYPEDLFFNNGFNKSNWIALANSLKLRALVNMRLVDPTQSLQGINSLLSNDIIDTAEEDFQFRYEEDIIPSNPHPFIARNYRAGGVIDYLSNNFYDFLNAGDSELPFIEEGIQDPRLRYYIYRQHDQAPSGNFLPCEGSSNYDYCYVGNLYWGRDHSDTEGIPNGALRRSTFGIYPGGGTFDRDLFFQARTVEEGLNGAGIFPMLLSSFTNFLLAESVLTIGTSGNDRNYLESGMRQSFEKVSSFADGQELGGFGMTPSSIDDYVTRILNEYDASSTNGKLEIISREYFIASWGNGYEIYNTYRRTGFPNLQSPIFSAGNFPRVFRYPEEAVLLNTNLSQQSTDNQAFWDNNPAGFID